MDKTYNVAAFGLPANLLDAVRKLAAGAMPLYYSKHALSEALNDRYGVMTADFFPRAFIPGAGWSVVEVESDSRGALVKFVVRRQADARRSLVMVIDMSGCVRTLWTNLNSDQHATLDSSKFSRP